MSLVCRRPVRPAVAATGRPKSLIYLKGEYMQRDTTRRFCYQARATPAEYSAGLRLAIERGWLVMHESGTFVKVTETGAELFA